MGGVLKRKIRTTSEIGERRKWGRGTPHKSKFKAVSANKWQCVKKVEGGIVVRKE